MNRSVALLMRDPALRLALCAGLRQHGFEPVARAELAALAGVLEQPGWAALVLGDDVVSGEERAALARQAVGYDPRRCVAHVEILPGGELAIGLFGEPPMRVAADRAGALLAERLERARQPTPVLAEVVGEDGACRQTIRGRNPQVARVVQLVETIAPTDSTVLCEGESGTGKDLFARLIHQKSRRHAQPFVAVNCGAIPQTLIESELFGHEKGAFTGAVASRAGLCEAADGGTLFLDEIGEMPLDMQVKLLRVLQSGWLRPVGSTRSVKVNVRVIAATNRDLRQEVKEGRFRLDLYYRLNVINIRLPALRERAEDIPDLVSGIADRLVNGGAPRPSFAPEALRSLSGYSWPGNIRELENIVERLTLLHAGRVIGSADVTSELGDCELRAVEGGASPSQPGPGSSYPEDWTLRQVEEAHIRRALERHGGNQTRAARALGINVKTLYNRMKAAGLRREDFQLHG